MKAKYIPNILSSFRIVLVAVFAWVFLATYPDGILASVGIFMLSGLTDVVDGALARHFGWVSRVGKVLDPIADKLMQCTVLFCLALKGVAPWWIFAFFVVKEGCMAGGALFLFKKRNEVYGSKFFGKAATVLFYAVVAVIILWGDRLDPVIVNFLCVCAALAAILALVLYFFSYLRGKKMGISRKTSNVSEDGSSN